MSTTELTAARLQRPGPDGARILLIAGRSWLESTTSPDQHRVPVRILDRLWLSARRGIELDVVCGVGRIVRLLETFADAWDVAAYDAVVLLPDLGRPPLSPRLLRVLDRVSTVTRVLGVSDAVIRPGDRTGALPGATTGWSEIRIVQEPGACPAALVAEAVGGALLGVLDRSAGAQQPAQPETVTDHLRRIALLASTALAVGSATIAVLGSGRARTLAAVGSVIPDESLVLAAAVRPVVVLDTWRDDRLARAVRPGGGVRFFAAHPLEIEDGSLMGTLSVLDAEPRTADDFDVDVLRDLAVLASAELQYAGALG